MPTSTARATMLWPMFSSSMSAIAATGVTQMARDATDLENSIDKGLAYFERNLKTIAEICRANGVTLVLLTQPSRLSQRDLARYRNEFFLYNRKIRDVSEEANVPFVDMFAEMGHDTDLYVDEIHYSPKGIEKFSRILYRHLKHRI